MPTASALKQSGHCWASRRTIAGVMTALKQNANCISSEAEWPLLGVSTYHCWCHDSPEAKCQLHTRIGGARLLRHRWWGCRLHSGSDALGHFALHCWQEVCIIDVARFTASVYTDDQICDRGLASSLMFKRRPGTTAPIARQSFERALKPLARREPHSRHGAGIGACLMVGHIAWVTALRTLAPSTGACTKRDLPLLVTRPHGCWCRNREEAFAVGPFCFCLCLDLCCSLWWHGGLGLEDRQSASMMAARGNSNSFEPDRT